MSAMALMVVKASDASDARKDRLCQIGIDASEVCISSNEYITAGLMAKSCESSVLCVWRKPRREVDGR